MFNTVQPKKALVSNHKLQTFWQQVPKHCENRSAVNHRKIVRLRDVLAQVLTKAHENYFVLNKGYYSLLYKWGYLREFANSFDRYRNLVVWFRSLVDFKRYHFQL